MTRPRYLDRRPPSFGATLTLLIFFALAIGFVVGLFAAAVVMGGF